jgi:hypothetical protein
LGGAYDRESIGDLSTRGAMGYVDLSNRGIGRVYAAEDSTMVGLLLLFTALVDHCELSV